MNDMFGTIAPRLPFDLPKKAGYSAVWRGEVNGFHVSVPNGYFIYSEKFFNRKWSDRTLEYLQENDTTNWLETDWRHLSAEEFQKIRFDNIFWKQDFIKLYGKEIPLPRLTSWYGDDGRTYTYSGIRSRPNPWNEGLLRLRERIEAAADTSFNSVLLNWYRDGRDCLSWHADDEKELGINPVIASANFGASRDFLIRRNSDPSEKLSIPLGHGTLMIMGGEMQHFWQHSIPKRSGVKGSRFNLTFRRID